MGSELLLGYISTAQYSLFFGVGLVIFGWMEKKDKLELSGQAVFVLLGVLAAWIVSTNHIEVSNQNIENLSKPVRALLFFKLCIGLGGLSLATIALGLLKNKLYKAGLVVSSVIALALFFMVLSILQMPK